MRLHLKSFKTMHDEFGDFQNISRETLALMAFTDKLKLFERATHHFADGETESI